MTVEAVKLEKSCCGTSAVGDQSCFQTRAIPE